MMDCEFSSSDGSRTVREASSYAAPPSHRAELTEVSRQQPVLVAARRGAGLARTAPVARAEHAEERLRRGLRVCQLTHEVDDLIEARLAD